MSTVQLLADDPLVVGAGRITAKVKVADDVYDSDRSNDTGEGSRAVVEPRPLTVLFVPVAATDELAPACADVQAVADGFEEHMLASWPVNPRYSHVLTDCTGTIFHAPGLTDAGLMGARGLLARLDRLKWTGLMIDKVVGVTPRGWFARQEMPGLKQAVGAAPLGGTLDAAIVERQNTGGWVVAHELAHQLGWTEQAGAARQPPRRGARARLLGRRAPRHPRDHARLHALLDGGRGRAQDHRPLDLQADVGLPDEQARLARGRRDRARAWPPPSSARSP